MKVMILAAGRGERMRPLTDNTPKPLLKVGGKSLIGWHIEHLVKAGFKEIIINHAYLGQQIEQALGDGTRWDIRIHYSPEKIALETAGGIANALPLLGSDPFLVVNADIFSEIDFGHLTQALPLSGMAHLVMVDNPPQHPQGDFCLEAGRLRTNGTAKLTFSGVGVYSPELFKKLVRGEAAKLAPLLVTAMEDDLVTGEYYQGVWHDIGTPERLESVDDMLRKQLKSH